MTIHVLSNPPTSLKEYTRVFERYDGSGILIDSTPSDHTYTSVDPKVISDRTVLVSGETEGFHRRLREQELVPFTELHVVSESVDTTDPVAVGWRRSGGTCSTKVNLGRISADGYSIGGISQVSATLTSPTPEDYDPLLQEALGEAKSGALLVLLELAEAHKTVNLVLGFRRNLLKRGKKILSIARRKYKPKNVKDLAIIFSDMWLEYRYGWRQLYFSSQDIIGALEVMAQPRDFVVNTGRGFTSNVNTAVPSVIISDPWINVPVLTKTATSTLEQRAVVSLQIKKELAALDFNLIGLGYELVPFSFVLDWFVNVGDIVRSIWPVPYSELTAATSWKLTDKVDITTGIGPFSCDIHHQVPGRYTHIREEYHRVPYEGDIPVVFNVNPRLGLSRILDLVSLTVGQAKRHNFNSIRV
jgi:hypothetical protein